MHVYNDSTHAWTLTAFLLSAAFSRLFILFFSCLWLDFGLWFSFGLLASWLGWSNTRSKLTAFPLVACLHCSYLPYLISSSSMFWRTGSGSAKIALSIGGRGGSLLSFLRITNRRSGDILFTATGEGSGGSFAGFFTTPSIFSRGTHLTGGVLGRRCCRLLRAGFATTSSMVPGNFQPVEAESAWASLLANRLGTTSGVGVGGLSVAAPLVDGSLLPLTSIFLLELACSAPGRSSSTRFLRQRRRDR